MPVAEVSSVFQKAEWNQDGSVKSYGELGAAQIVQNVVWRNLKADTKLLEVFGDASRIRMVESFDRTEAPVLPVLLLALYLIQPELVPGMADMKGVVLYGVARFQTTGLDFPQREGEAGWATLMDYVETKFNNPPLRSLLQNWQGTDFELVAGPAPNSPAGGPGQRSAVYDLVDGRW